MPISLSFQAPSTFFLNATGHVTYGECRAIFNELLAHAQLKPDSRILTDGRTVTKVPSTEELRALTKDLQPLMDRGVSALGILTSSAFVYGVARMFSTFAEPMNFSVPVFNDADEAQRWLTARLELS